jgi:Iron-sulfur cluster-binding domain
MTKKIKPIWNNDGSCSEDSPNKTFCMAPWSHTYISPQGERRLCCASREQHSFQKQYIDASNDIKYGEVKDSKTKVEEFNPISLEEHWNSPYMRDIRKKLMAGEKISQCDVCNDDILSISSYRKWFTGVLFKDKIQEAFDNTDENGYTTMPVISFDYRYSNLCNFKCRMCGEQLSSSWESEKKKHDLWSPKHQPFMIPEVKKKMQTFQTEVVETEFKDAISKGIVEEIYWVGGEPLMYDIHWWALDEMIKNGSAKNCFLRYNSNLSRIEYKGQQLFDYLPQFKNWLMCASIDGTGKIVEFIRKGIVWEEWLNNFKTGLQAPGGKDKMIFDLTITGPGMFALKDLFDLSRELDVKLETKIMFAFHPDIVFSPFAWPKNILHRKIDELLNYMIPLATHKQMTLINTLKEMKNRPTFEEQWPDIYEREFKNGKSYQDKLDRIRQEEVRLEDIYMYDTELYNWWKRFDA